MVWAVDAAGDSPAWNFFVDLKQGDQAKILALFNGLAANGRIPSRERFKKLETRRGWALWEFKSFQIRFIGAFSRLVTKEFVIAHGLVKKRDKLRSTNLDRAVRILESHASR